MSERKPRRWLRILLGTVAVILVIVGAAWLWLTAREVVPEHSDYVISLDELRKLADSLPGPKPVGIATELVAEASLPRAAVFAGEPFTPHPMVHQAFQVRWADGGFLLIDSGFGPELLQRMRGGTYHEGGFAKVLVAMANARRILITHEHADHLSGLSQFQPPGAVGSRLLLTSEQLANTARLDEAKIPEAMRQGATRLDFDRAVAVMPGVVVQKAPGHTPGSIIIFVHTEEGRELLFIGDVAWHLDQLRNLHYRPRFVTDFFIHEDRKAVLAEFRALHDLMQANPNLVVVSSHDQDERQQLLASGVLSEGF